MSRKSYEKSISPRRTRDLLWDVNPLQTINNQIQDKYIELGDKAWFYKKILDSKKNSMEVIKKPLLHADVSKGAEWVCRDAAAK